TGVLAAGLGLLPGREPGQGLFGAQPLEAAGHGVEGHGPDDEQRVDEGAEQRGGDRAGGEHGGERVVEFPADRAGGLPGPAGGPGHGMTGEAGGLLPGAVGEQGESAGFGRGVVAAQPVAGLVRFQGVPRDVQPGLGRGGAGHPGGLDPPGEQGVQGRDVDGPVPGQQLPGAAGGCAAAGHHQSGQGGPGPGEGLGAAADAAGGGDRGEEQHHVGQSGHEHVGAPGGRRAVAGEGDGDVPGGQPVREVVVAVGGRPGDADDDVPVVLQGPDDVPERQVGGGDFVGEAGDVPQAGAAGDDDVQSGPAGRVQDGFGVRVDRVVGQAVGGGGGVVRPAAQGVGVQDEAVG